MFVIKESFYFFYTCQTCLIFNYLVLCAYTGSKTFFYTLLFFVILIEQVLLLFLFLHFNITSPASNVMSF